MLKLPKYSVCFRIIDETLDPVETTNKLCINPDRAHKKGDPNTAVNKKGKLITFAPFSTGTWIIDSREGEYEDLEHHITSLLHILYPLKDKLAELSAKGYRMDIFCGVFLHEADQPGFDIKSDVLLKMGELNIELGMCLYT
jgi:hypothetical protein